MARPPRAVDFMTLPYPGFPTDLQPMALALAAVADGHSLITENVFEARFRFVDEMIRMGADARTDGHHASVRGGAAVQRAGLVHRYPGRRRPGARRPARRGCHRGARRFHIDRGYPHFVEDLLDLGADVRRVGRGWPERS